MSTEDVTAEIAAVLAEHAAFGWDGYGYHRCRCGYPLTSTEWADARPKWTTHLAHHLAGLLAGLLAARDRRVRAEAIWEYRDALAGNESAENWMTRDDYLHDLTDWATWVEKADA